LRLPRSQRMRVQFPQPTFISGRRGFLTTATDLGQYRAIDCRSVGSSVAINGRLGARLGQWLTVEDHWHDEGLKLGWRFIIDRVNDLPRDRMILFGDHVRPVVDGPIVVEND